MFASNALDKELLRWNWFVYEKEQTQYSDSCGMIMGLWLDQHDYIKRIDTTNFKATADFTEMIDGCGYGVE